MSVKIMAEVWEASDTSGPTELLVLLALADNADAASRECWPSLAYIAAKTKTSESTVRRALRRLERRGQISVAKPANTAHRAATYRVHPALKPDPGQNGTPVTGDRSGVPPVTPEPSVTVRSTGTTELPTGEDGERNGKDPNPGSAVVARARRNAGPAIRHNRRPVPDVVVTRACELLDAFNAQAGSQMGAWTAAGEPSEGLRRIIGAIVAYPPVAAHGEAMIAAALADPYWTGRPQPGVVFGPKVVQRYLDEARLGPAPDPLRASLDRWLAQQDTVEGTAVEHGAGA